MLVLLVTSVETDTTSVVIGNNIYLHPLYICFVHSNFLDSQRIPKEPGKSSESETLLTSAVAHG